jgi:hypothetical protein
MQSLEWGLKNLGHTVSYALNNSSSYSTNIIFGAQVLTINSLEQLPKGTIIYNLEQMRGKSIDQIAPEIKYIADNFEIWDYSSANVSTWELLNTKKIKVVPIGYAPILTRIPKPSIQDIDILIYGMTGDKRLDIFHKLSHAGLRVLFASGFYGESRDQLIARSKIILNINLYDFSQIFEIARVSYLLANKKAVIGTLDPNTYIEEDILKAIKFVKPDMVVESCNDFLTYDYERGLLEQGGFSAFAKRDIRNILESALESYT